MLDDVIYKLRARRLWKDYGITWWDLDSFPAPVLDDMLQLDYIEGLAIEEMR